MTLKDTDNQYGRPHPSDSWLSSYTTNTKVNSAFYPSG